MEGSEFDQTEFFRRIGASGVRALLIGRQALIVMGFPYNTSDYDYWIHIDDIAALNEAVAPLGLVPNHSPDQARARGRYVLENDEHVDVVVARSVPTIDSVRVAFDDLWARRRTIELSPGVAVHLPSIEDLIQTKRFASRPRDAEDIRVLTALLEKERT